MDEWYASLTLAMTVLGFIGLLMVAWKVIPVLAVMLGLISVLTCLIRFGIWVFYR